MLGGARMTEFISAATYYSAREQVHNNYIIRAGHEIYNAPISILHTPDSWLKQLPSNFNKT